jgi:hypothetical protein
MQVSLFTGCLHGTHVKYVYTHVQVHPCPIIWQIKSKVSNLFLYTIFNSLIMTSVCDTLSLAFYILWHRSSSFCGTNQLPVNHMVFCFAYYDIHNSMYLRYNNIVSHPCQCNVPWHRLVSVFVWVFNHFLILEKTSPLLFQADI